MSNKKPNPKQKRFCEEYIIDLNATQAAIRAGYSKKTAQEQSSRLLSYVMVKEYIKELKTDREESTKLTAETVVNAIAEIALSTEAKDNDKIRALDLLGKHFGIFAVDNAQSRPEAIVKITRKYL